MLIVSAASVYSWVLTKEQIPQALTNWMISNISNKYIFLLFCNVFLLIVGMFIEGNASMIILVPLLPPIAAAHGHPDVCHLRHHQVQDGRVYQGGGPLLYPAVYRPDALHLLPALYHPAGGPVLLIFSVPAPDGAGGNLLEVKTMEKLNYAVL